MLIKSTIGYKENDLDIKKIKKLDQKEHEVSYQNEFIDDVVLDFDKNSLIIFFYLIYKFQQETGVSEVNINEIKRILDNKRREKRYVKKIVEKLYDTTIYYKSPETVIENGYVKIGKNDYIKDHLFDILVFPEQGDNLKFVIKKRYQEYFLNLKDNFTTTAIETLKNLNGTQILIYLQLNRWKNYSETVEMNWEYFKLNTGFTKGYKNNDVLRKLDKALQKIKETTGMEVKYRLVRSNNKREILKIIFKINEAFKELKRMLKSKNPIEKEYARITLKKLEKNKWQEDE